MWLSIDLKSKWFGCQLIWDSNDLAVNRFETQMSWLSTDLRFKWFGCQMVWGSSDLVANWCVIQMILLNEAFLRDSLRNWSFEAPKRSISAGLPSKMKLWSSKTKHLCETSFKIEALKLKNEAFFRDFLQNWSFEAPKRSISARLPSKMKLWSPKTKHLCETSFKNETLKLKNEAFLRDFLQNDMSTRHLTSELQYVLAIFNWMLQKYCACHEKVEPRHTKSCNYHAKWSLQSNTSVTWNLQPFHGFSVGGFKHRHHRARNHATRNASFQTLFKPPTPANVFATLTNSCACHVLCNVSKSLRLPRETHFEPPKTSRDRQSVFNDFDFRIVRARRRGANFANVNFQKCSEPATF